MIGTRATCDRVSGLTWLQPLIGNLCTTGAWVTVCMHMPVHASMYVRMSDVIDPELETVTETAAELMNSTRNAATSQQYTTAAAPTSAVAGMHA